MGVFQDSFIKMELKHNAGVQNDDGPSKDDSVENLQTENIATKEPPLMSRVLNNPSHIRLTGASQLRSHSPEREKTVKIISPFPNNSESKPDPGKYNYLSRVQNVKNQQRKNLNQK